MEEQQHVKSKREPLIHITKRDVMPLWKTILVRAIAIVAALVISAGIILLLTQRNPAQVFVAMFKGSFETPRKMLNMLQDMAMLLCIALAVTPAFKMKFWNLGAEGQVLVGGLASAACMFYAKDSLPSWLLILVMLLASLLSGIIWGVLPAVFKAIHRTRPPVDFEKFVGGPLDGSDVKLMICAVELGGTPDKDGYWTFSDFTGAGELRAYIVVPGVDWWQTEFTILNGDGELVWRDATHNSDSNWKDDVGDEYSVSVGPGKTVKINFDRCIGIVE